MNHRDTVLDQFSRQAVPFSNAPAISDAQAIERLLDVSGAGPGLRSLDVACGPGLLVLAFARRVRLAEGVDVTPAMLQRARELQRSRGVHNVDWHLGDAERLPFDDATFDIVTCRFAFHHFERPEGVLREMARVTRPGGCVLVCDAVASPDPAKAAAFNEMERLRDPSTVRFLTLEALTALFPAAGLGAPDCTGYSVPVELEGLMKVSFPAPDAAHRVRAMIAGSAEGDTLGLGTRRQGDRVVFAYPAAVLRACKPG